MGLGWRFQSGVQGSRPRRGGLFLLEISSDTSDTLMLHPPYILPTGPYITLAALQPPNKGYGTPGKFLQVYSEDVRLNKGRAFHVVGHHVVISLKLLNPHNKTVRRG